MTLTRVETDSLGSLEIPAEAYWGIHTARALENFPITRRAISNYPDLIRSLVLLDTTADAEPYKLKYQAMNLVARFAGLRAVSSGIMPALYGKTTLNDPARADERYAWKQQLESNRNTIWRAVNGVLDRKSIHSELGKITAPTLVAVGEEDTSTPPAMAERIAGAIAGAKLVVIPNAGHGTTQEQPAIVTAAIGAFLDAQPNAAVPLGTATPGISGVHAA